jgi:hypothetical protein
LEKPVLSDPTPAAHLERLTGLIGKERALDEVTQTLHFLANGLRPDTVGAIHVTCADESELECVEAFQKGFAHYLLPPIKFALRAPMRLANLGGQYEWGAVRIAEQHYATSESRAGFKLLVVKINAHVGVLAADASAQPTGSRVGLGTRVGVLRRYEAQSPCCGALDAVLSGSTQPFAEDLRELWGSEGLDRDALLRDDSKVNPALRLLASALASARLQARKALLDIQDYSPSTATYWLVVPCVTLNRPGRDTEIVCGFYTLDGRKEPTPLYRGLGDNPAEYQISENRHGFEVEDEHIGKVRRGRDHRSLARAQWQGRSPMPVVKDERLDRIRRDVAEDKHRDHRHAKTLLRIALPILAEVAPVPAAVLMFAEGAVSIRHAFRVHKLAHELEGSEQAREILSDIHAQVDQLDDDHAEALIDLLVKEYSA